MELRDLDVNQRLSVRLTCEPVVLSEFGLKRVATLIATAYGSIASPSRLPIEVRLNDL
jgi:hypothetical protein